MFATQQNESDLKQHIKEVISTYIAGFGVVCSQYKDNDGNDISKVFVSIEFLNKNLQRDDFLKVQDKLLTVLNAIANPTFKAIEEIAAKFPEEQPQQSLQDEQEAQSPPDFISFSPYSPFERAFSPSGGFYY
jgi:hypothetical protein